MLEFWRYACARCGSQGVNGNVGPGWQCQNCGAISVVWDLKYSAWKEAKYPVENRGFPLK